MIKKPQEAEDPSLWPGIVVTSASTLDRNANIFVPKTQQSPPVPKERPIAMRTGSKQSTGGWENESTEALRSMENPLHFGTSAPEIWNLPRVKKTRISKPIWMGLKGKN